MILQNYPTSFQQASGEIPYNMTNDYMFRAVMQSNNKVLCGLIRALLHIPKDLPLTAEITNPIVLGEAIEQKEFRLDIHVVINQQKLLNLEMQVANLLNWPNRSLSYLCRTFDQLNHGEDYDSIQPAIHIGFLDYTLFPEVPEFYAHYKMLNVKNHHIYSDNFDLRVVDLTQIDLATKEDKQYCIHDWATLFKVTTWEGLHMLASKDEYLSEASNTIFRLSADEEIRKRCLDREDYYSDLRSYQKEVQKLKAEKDVLVQEKDLVTKEKDLIIKEKEAAMEEIARLKALLEKRKSDF